MKHVKLNQHSEIDQALLVFEKDKLVHSELSRDIVSSLYRSIGQQIGDHFSPEQTVKDQRATGNRHRLTAEVVVASVEDYETFMRGIAERLLVSNEAAQHRGWKQGIAEGKRLAAEKLSAFLED